MKKYQHLKTAPTKARSRRLAGFTLIEMIIAMAASLIVFLAVGILTSSGQRSWTKTYNSNNSDLQVGTISATAALGAFGRKANKTDYRLYKLVGGKYERVVPETDPEEVVVGDAVEFRYWNTELNADIMNSNKTATAYVLFYIDNGNLKTDYGPFPPGSINETGHRITGNGVATVTLIRNVTAVEFSHTTQNMAGDGKGCIRMKLTATDPITGNPKVILAATLMRNTWP
jgi:prepilin-type N-terminal cleavage/methylation domain-containing protein